VGSTTGCHHSTQREDGLVEEGSLVEEEEVVLEVVEVDAVFFQADHSLLPNRNNLGN
jgi:hypothetical protein